MIEQWAPTIICAGALGFVWFDIRSHKKNTNTEIKDIKKCKNDYITKEAHGLLCENAALKINEHTTEKITASEKKILEAINGGK